MFIILKRSILLTLFLSLLLCGAYPVLITGIGKVFFSKAASGGLLTGKDGRVVGAKLIGQSFSKPEYFHGRPSSAGEKGYDAANSSGSNLGPTSQKLADTVKANIDNVLKENSNLKFGEIPVDMVTASGSGLDPHITPENAFAQVARVAATRGMAKEKLEQIVTAHIEDRQWGIFGEEVVNVLVLNLDLDSNSAQK